MGRRVVDPVPKPDPYSLEFLDPDAYHKKPHIFRLFHDEKNNKFLTA
jgi:hypothetical protein